MKIEISNDLAFKVLDKVNQDEKNKSGDLNTGITVEEAILKVLNEKVKEK